MGDETRETRKNIVLCSDGTGQTGAAVGGTNVWKIRMGVDRHDHLEDRRLRRQIVFYDAGVGTSKLSVQAALGNVFGYGLAANMRQLYTNLAKNYREGDRIYIFGFSRGAFTARSLAGMISEVGVVDGRRDNKELEELVVQAYRAYRASPRKQPIKKFQERCKRKGVEIRDAPIHFVGVWDTVDAYGVPFEELKKPTYWLLHKILRPHNDGLTEKMRYAYQAIAIDEDRRSFAPTLYDEKRAEECGVTIDQVWFAGAHSNVGGGYARQGLSDVALHWMITKAEQAKGDGERGLRFTAEARSNAQSDMDGNSTLYDQRSGPGAIWRYLPRNVGELCRQANTPPRIHVSAMDRIQLATADYGPITLPVNFEVVGTDAEDAERLKRFNECVKNEAGRMQREQAIEPAKRLIAGRARLYRVFMSVLALVVILVGLLWFRPDGTIATYRERSFLTSIGTWIGGQSETLTAFAGDAWSFLEGTAKGLTPGGPDQLADRLVGTVFKLPEGVLAILVVGVYLLIRKKQRVAQLKHLGLNLWRKCLEP